MDFPTGQDFSFSVWFKVNNTGNALGMVFKSRKLRLSNPLKKAEIP